MNCRKIGNQAIMMSCIQTLPGHEFSVAEELKQEFERRNLKPYSLLKGFGAFDIILLYPASSFDFQLINFTLKNVLKSNLFLCFPYILHQPANMFDVLNQSYFCGISMLKKNPATAFKTLDAEKMLIDKFNTSSNGLNYCLLGTLGWYENILLINGQDLDRIVKELFYATEQEQQCYIKTFSLAAINYNVIPEISKVEDSENYYRKFETNEGLKKEIPEDVNTDVYVVSEPIFTKEIASYWPNQQFQISEGIGKYDLIVSANKPMTWGYFLASLLKFRHELKDKILSTSTKISKKYAEKKNPGDQVELRRANTVHFKYEDLLKIFDEKIAEKLLDAFNLLNSLSQNPILGNSFDDLLSYPVYLVKEGQNIKQDVSNKKQKELKFVADGLELIKQGVELRLYGTYGIIDNTLGQLTRSSGGVHASLRALSSIPATIFPRWGGDWDGFVISNAHKFCTINEVINVPNNALFHPRLWWALYHEIGHIWLNNRPEIVSKELQEIKTFLTNKDYPNYWIILLKELVAEVVGFEIGFYGNYDLFLELVWKYLYFLCRLQEQNHPDNTYLVRTFFVYIFEKHFRHEKISESDFKDEDFLYKEFVAHIDKIIKIANIEDRKDKYIIAARNTKTFKELLPWAKILFKYVNEFKMIRDDKELTSDNTINIVNSIKEGLVWDGLVEAPEAILYNIFSNKKEQRFEESIATILTFSNIYPILLAQQKERKYR